MVEKSFQSPTVVAVGLGFLGSILGIISGATVMSGDEYGRVNLLFFILLFVLIPLLSLFASIILLASRKNGIATLILDLPLWPAQFKIHRNQFALEGNQSSWLFLQSQIFTLFFSAGNLFIFFLLLIGTDVSFVWRSTLLDAVDLLPSLSMIALPWYFWADAQPTIELLEISQNSRLDDITNTQSGAWWRFALAAQLSYSIIPRICMLAFAIWKFKQQSVASSVENFVYNISNKDAEQNYPQPTLAPLAFTTSSPYQLLDWAHLPKHTITFVGKSFGSAQDIQRMTAAFNRQDINQLNSALATVVAVKSWEPPLAELKDCLDLLPVGESNYLLPLDWNDDKVLAVNKSHLEEWRRFADTLGQWQVLQPGEHS